jgi:hypothetical protein
LRFPDGSTLKELLTAKELEKKLKQTLAKQEAEEDVEDDELDLDELDRRTDTVGSQDEESENDSDALANAVSKTLANLVDDHDSDGEASRLRIKRPKDSHERETEIERQLKIKREQDRRKNIFRDKITDLVDDEDNRDKLIDGFDDKMRSLDNMLSNEN